MFHQLQFRFTILAITFQPHHLHLQFKATPHSELLDAPSSEHTKYSACLCKALQSSFTCLSADLLVFTYVCMSKKGLSFESFVRLRLYAWVPFTWESLQRLPDARFPCDCNRYTRMYNRFAFFTFSKFQPFDPFKQFAILHETSI